METLKPWIFGPLELIKHAEEHQQTNKDFDKRMALIGYDNAIEVSIRTYLQLHPTQREGIEYTRENVAKWLTNYHSLLNFFFDEFTKTLGQTPPIAKNTYIHYHNLRNNLYHEGKDFVPPERDVQGIHAAALYIFSTLFNVDGEELLKNSPTLHTPITRKFNFQGTGYDAFKAPLKVGPTIFRIIYKGKSYHTCELLDEQNNVIARLIRYPSNSPTRVSTHQYSVTRYIEKEGIYLLKVHANTGTWRIEVE